MSRFIQQQNKPPKKEKDPRTLQKPGKYTSKELTESKKIPTKGGYQ